MSGALARINHAADVMYAAGMGTVTIRDLRESRAAVAELIAAAEDVADEHMGLAAATRYDGKSDVVGDRVCCGVTSYRAHANDCQAVRLRAAIAACKGGEQ
jgi:hypothetical protein